MSCWAKKISHYWQDLGSEKILYLQILKENSRDSVQKLDIANCYSFYQDNDAKYRAENVFLWLVYNCSHAIETPAQSPNFFKKN